MRRGILRGCPFFLCIVEKAIAKTYLKMVCNTIYKKVDEDDNAGKEKAYTLSISRCSGGDGVEESFKAKIKRREAALDAFAVAEAYCKESWMVSRCAREGFDGFIIDLCSDAEDETIRLVRLVPDSEDGIMDDVFRLEYGSCEYKV